MPLFFSFDFTSGFVSTSPETRFKNCYAATAIKLCAACLGSRLASLLLQSFASNTNSFLLVRIGRTQRTNVRSHLAHLSFVCTADDQMGLLLDGNLNPFGNWKLDGMRFAKREIHDLAFRLRAVTYTDEFHIFL